jgi:hypothetical protein
MNLSQLKHQPCYSYRKEFIEFFNATLKDPEFYEEHMNSCTKCTDAFEEIAEKQEKVFKEIGDLMKEHYANKPEPVDKPAAFILLVVTVLFLILLTFAISN